MRVYITKAALTKGIIITDGELIEDGSNWLKVPASKTFFFGASFPSRQWTTDEAIARKRVQEMKERKIALLRKQIAKLESMEIRVTEDQH